MGFEEHEPTAAYQERLRDGRTSVGLYRPRDADPQEPHEQDEVYIVRRGSGTFVLGAQRTPFGPGDVFFVGADEVHRFEEFSADLEVWVVFFGPPGGDAGLSETG